MVEGEQSTKWSIIASGEGANRIAFLYYAKFQNPAIGDRVLLLNTTVADIKPDKTFKYILERDPQFQQIFEKIRHEKICIFGASPSGAGNNWKVGENEARDDFETIRRYITKLGLSGSDALLFICTLAGGTGSGSIPYIMNRLKYGEAVFPGQNGYIALGILPFDTEGPQRHFNTICSITRLLKYGEKNKQNVDMLVLVDNTQVEKIMSRFGIDIGQFKEDAGLSEERYHTINQEVIKAISMMIAAGGSKSKSTVDINDFIQWPRQYGCYHFTPCLSLGNDLDVLGLEAAIEHAFENPMVPIDPTTSTMAYFIVRAPKKYVDDKRFTQEGLEDLTREFAVENLIGDQGGLVRYNSLIPTEEQDTYDVVILVGGFDLKKLVSKSLKGYLLTMETIKASAEHGTAEIEDEEDPNLRTKINVDELDDIEKQMKEYIKHTNDLIEKTKKEIDVKEWLDKE